jgi:signal transduction histidine kinase
MATAEGFVVEDHDSPEADVRPSGAVIARLLQCAGSAGAGLTTAAAVVTAVTVLVYPLQQLDPGVSSGVPYLLGVLLVSVRWGLPLGLATSVASAAALYLFHTSPSGFHAKGAADVVGIGTLLVTAFVASVIADRARLRAEDAEERLRLEEELRKREAERIRLQEVRASRARVIQAADDERRRVTRDLHDGAQQRLVHMVITTKLARRALEKGDDPRPLLADALDQAERATGELRELAHGILPAVLARAGLRAGVEALASRTPVPVDIAVSAGRLPASVEATAYFVVAEALTNVAKHSHAERAEVTARVDAGELRIRVRDTGVGGAQPDGSGLVGLADRVAALDGRFRVESPAGCGTLVAADIPLPR